MDTENVRMKKIASAAEGLRDWLTTTRRDFYMWPELSGNEVRTSGIVAERLRALGLEVQTGVGGYGVIGLLRGALNGPTVAWRADMDAFLTDDTLQTSYASRVPGVKHVCGHDVHTTIGLGIANVLTSMRESLAGSVKFIFQPAEETAVGARAVVSDGGLENPRPEVIFGLHVAPLPVGKVGCIPLTALPGWQTFQVLFQLGDGNLDFEALAKAGIDAVCGLSTVQYPSNFDEFNALLQMLALGGEKVARNVFIQSWLVHGPNNQNIIGFGGILRANSETFSLEMLDAMKVTLDEVLAGVGYMMTLGDSLPAVVNDAGWEAALRPVLEKVAGPENVLEVKAAFPYNGEDFSIYQQEIPGVFYWLGVANLERSITGIMHHPDFDVDEDCLVVGVNLMSNLLANALEKCNFPARTSPL